MGSTWNYDSGRRMPHVAARCLCSMLNAAMHAVKAGSRAWHGLQQSLITQWRIGRWARRGVGVGGRGDADHRRRARAGKVRRKGRPAQYGYADSDGSGGG